MTYRDDHDAALARADALAEEVEQLKREREKLAGELDAAKAHEAAAVAAASAPPPAPVPTPPTRDRAPDDSTSDAESDWATRRAARRTGERKVGYVVAGILALSMAGAGLYGFFNDRAKTNARKDTAAREAADQIRTDRLHIAANFSACIAASAWGDEYDQFYAEKHCRDMKRESCDGAFGVRRFACVRELEALANDPGYPTTAAGPALDHLRQANRAIAAARDRAQRDAAVAQRRAAYKEVRADVLPAFRKTIDATLATATKHDDAYWRAKIIVEFRDLIDAVMVASKVEQGGELDLVAAALVARPLLDRIEAEVSAPTDIHYRVKNFSYFTKEIRDGVLDRDTIELFVHNELSTIPISSVH